MFARMMAKEWKEKFGLFLFGLLGLAAFVLSFSLYSQNREMADILTGAAILVFLPVFSLLLGASGFSSELRDDAWTYLFSRPVKKSKIWAAKYISLLSILIVVLMILALLAEVHPALRAAREALRIPLEYGEDIPFWILAYVLPFFLLTLAFSFSVLSDKSHVVVFLSGLTAVFLQAALAMGVGLLVFEYWWFPGRGLRSVVSFLILLSFAAASILTLSRADFSQPSRRVWVFAKFSALFLLLTFGAGAIWTFASLKFRRAPELSHPEILNGAAYFEAGGGIYRFDPAEGRTRRIAKSRSAWGGFQFGGDKMTFLKLTVNRKLGAFEDLWIMNVNGKEARPLVRTSQEDSPLYDVYLYPVSISPSGDKVAFEARWGQRKIPENLWCVNADGTALRGYDVDLAEDGLSRILGFMDSDRHLLIADAPRGKEAWEEGAKLLRVNLESGAVETLAEYTREAQLQPNAGSDPSHSLVCYIHFVGGRSGAALLLLDARTLEQREIYKGESISGFHWNRVGDKLAFLTGHDTLGIYSLPEDKITQIKDLPGYDFRWPSFALGWTEGDELVLRKFSKEGSSLCILDGNLTERKIVRLPFASSDPTQFWAAGHYVLIINTEKEQLWGVDLKTDRWQRLY